MEISMSDKKYVVTIARQFGSLGRPIAMRMSEKLGIEFYDRDIVEEAAKKLNLPVSKINEIEESAKHYVKTNNFRRMMYPLGTQTDELQNKLFEAQQNIIRFLAERESCIIVGRCSDFILADEPNVMRIYIYAPYEARIKNCVEDLHLDETEAKRMIKAVDEARDHYHMNYTGYLPGDIRFKEIMIDSSMLGTEGTADFLVEAVKKKFEL
jgi:cytidylate kinase